jgi:hypothetical protein
MPGLLRPRPGKTEHVWDDPVYWRECRSRGARRTLWIGGLLILGLAVVLTVMNRDPAAGSLWSQVVDHSPNYMNFLIQAGMLMLCLRASVTIVDERRRGMLAPLALAGISPARLGWSKLKGALRPAVPLTASSETVNDLQADDDLSRQGVPLKPSSLRAAVSTRHPFGSSSSCCKRALSGGGKRAGQVASIRPTPIMSRM